MDGPAVLREETGAEEDDPARQDTEAHDSTDCDRSLEEIIDAYSDEQAARLLPKSSASLADPRVPVLCDFIEEMGVGLEVDASRTALGSKKSD